MFDDLDRTLRTLLIDEMPIVAERIEADGFDINFDVPNREFTGRLTRPTLNLYLFNVQENRERGRSAWTTVRNSTNGTGITSRPPVRVDCSYIVTAWSNEVADEHRLLSAAARVLFRNPILEGEVLQGDLAEQEEWEIRTEVAQPAAIKDIVDIWSVLDNDLKPSVRVTVTVPLELAVERTAPLTTGSDIGLDDPYDRLGPPSPIAIEGRVVRDGAGVGGVRIRIGGASAQTRPDGSFELRGVYPGMQEVLLAHDGEFIEMEAEITGEDTLVLELPARQTSGQRGRRRGGGDSSDGGE